MLIIFVASSGGTPPPSLPDLHIKDAESGQNVPVAGLEGWDNDFLQAQTICYAPMDFQDPETGKVAGDTTQAYWCRRLSKVLIRPLFSDAGATATITPLYYDKDNLESMGDSISISATTRQAGSDYMGRLAVVPTYGANRIAFLIETVSAGTLTLSMSGV